MGSRANYIVKSKNLLDIYYTHWRASDILEKLFQEKETDIVKEAFIQFFLIKLNNKVDLLS